MIPALFVLLATNASPNTIDLSCPCQNTNLGTVCRYNKYEFFVDRSGEVRPALLDTPFAVKSQLSATPGVSYVVEVHADSVPFPVPRPVSDYFRSLGIDIARAAFLRDPGMSDAVVVVRFSGDISVHKAPPGFSRTLRGGENSATAKCTTIAGSLGFRPESILVDITDCRTNRECIKSRIEGQKAAIIADAAAAQLAVALVSDQGSTLAPVVASVRHELFGGLRVAELAMRELDAGSFVVFVRFGARSTPESSEP